ncbi:hypothetical protein [Paenibacillus sp. FSL H3-0333]|uniref:hypothetical protein n=1 Tax=Paenibacillus sp. FSL H3-0333 TaxID=2921373 RepID=UPI0030F80542
MFESLRFFKDCYRYVELVPGKGYRIITMPYLASIPESISKNGYLSLGAGIGALNRGEYE